MNLFKVSSLICVEMYIWENNRIWIFSSLDIDFVDWPLVADTLRNITLVFFMGLSSWIVYAKFLVFLNSACWFFSKLLNLPDCWYNIISHNIFCCQFNQILWIINNERVFKLLNFFWQIFNILSESFLKSR